MSVGRGSVPRWVPQNLPLSAMEHPPHIDILSLPIRKRLTIIRVSGFELSTYVCDKVNCNINAFCKFATAVFFAVKKNGQKCRDCLFPNSSKDYCEITAFVGKKIEKRFSIF